MPGLPGFLTKTTLPWLAAPPSNATDGGGTRKGPAFVAAAENDMQAATITAAVLLFIFQAPFSISQIIGFDSLSRPTMTGLLLVGSQKLDATVESPALQGRIVAFRFGRAEASR